MNKMHKYWLRRQRTKIYEKASKGIWKRMLEHSMKLHLKTQTIDSHIT